MVLNKKVESAINKQINAEFYSSYLYLAMAAYFESINFSGFASWMKVQAKEEVEHAMRFYSYVVEKGGRVELSGIESPPKEWNSPLDAFQAAYKHETIVTASIYKIVDLAAAEKDYASSSMLKWFVDEQVEEEAQTDKIVQMLMKIKDSSGALIMLDKQLGKRKAGED